MATKYTVLFGRRAYPSDVKKNAKPIASCEIETPLESVFTVNVLSNAGTVAEAQAIVQAAYPEHCTDVPRVAPAAEVKES